MLEDKTTSTTHDTPMGPLATIAEDAGDSGEGEWAEPDERDLERRRAELDAENAALMREFEGWLAASGLAPKTVRRHVDNTWEYLFYLTGEHSRIDPTSAAEGIGCVNGYFSFDFIRDEYATKGMVNEAAGSVKKFYRFMLETGRVSQDDYDELLDDIRTFKPEWLELAQAYQDWDPDSGEGNPLFPW